MVESFKEVLLNWGNALQDVVYSVEKVSNREILGSWLRF